VGEEHISIGAAARLVGLSVKQLRRLADLGVVPSERSAGGHRLFDPEAIRRALLATPDLGLRMVVRETAAARPTWTAGYPLANLEEVDVWRDASDALGFTPRTDEYSVFHYASTELVNNSIDHSGGTRVDMRLYRDVVTEVRFEVQDDGVGAFERLRQSLGLAAPIEALVELNKGKGTSDPARHSGQGIFFTSRILDRFTLAANGIQWTVDNELGDQAVGVSPVTTGTLVSGSFSLPPLRTTAEVFRAYSDDDFAFSKTRPSVALAALGTEFVSRSEAKRVLARLDEFEHVDLDFSGVDSVGQAFVDEVFRVWPSVHPGTAIVPVNMNPAVEFMVRRGLPTRV
jgi:anti-sigma regulatory factor (Ser/Thr protein kinase)